MKYEFIEEHRDTFRVKRMCAALGVSRSGYYEWRDRPPSELTLDNARLLCLIRRIHLDSRENYGERKTWEALKARGESCGRHRVARLRRLAGLMARRIRRFRQSYATAQSEAPAPNLLNRDFTADRPNQAWVTDITFVPTRRGWLYVAVMVDLFARQVVGWAMSSRIDQQLVLDALDMAIKRRNPKPGLVVHSDQGQQYASAAYRSMLQRHGVLQSMSRKGNCLDNAVAESFFSTLKNELVHHEVFEDRDDARAAIFEFVETFYNRKRLHESLGFKTPYEFEAMANVA